MAFYVSRQLINGDALVFSNGWNHIIMLPMLMTL